MPRLEQCQYSPSCIALREHGLRLLDFETGALDLHPDNTRNAVECKTMCLWRWGPRRYGCVDLAHPSAGVVRHARYERNADWYGRILSLACRESVHFNPFFQIHQPIASGITETAFRTVITRLLHSLRMYFKRIVLVSRAVLEAWISRTCKGV